MATTNQTPNFNLPQWTANDNVGIMANLNPAFATIDEKLHEAVVNAENASTSASQASTTASEASKAVSEAETDITTLQADVLTLQNLVNAMNKQLEDSLNWTEVQFTPNPEVFTETSNFHAKLRNDKKILNLYGYMTMKKTELTGKKMFTSSQLRPKEQHNVTSIAGTKGTGTDNPDIIEFLPIRARCNTDGSWDFLVNYNYNLYNSTPYMFFQAMVNLDGWF